MFLEKENKKLKDKKSELEKKVEKFDELEKLEAWLPVEIKEKFKEYENILDYGAFKMVLKLFYIYFL